MSRVSTQQLYDHAYQSIRKARVKDSKTAEKVASQKEITKPSDDPQGYRFATEMRGEANVRDALTKNAHMAMSFMEATENTLSNVQEFVSRAYELTVAGADNIEHSSEIVGTAEELDSLRASIYQMVNLRFGGRTLLAGFRNGAEAFNKEGEYLGDDGVIEVELERGRYYPINVNGEQAILGTGLQGGVNIIETMDQVIEGFRNQNTEEVVDALGKLRGGVEQLSTYRAQIGARMAGIEAAIGTNETHKIELLDVASKIDEIDVAKTFSDLARDKTALEATVLTAEKLIKEVPPDMLFR